MSHPVVLINKQSSKKHKPSGIAFITVLYVMIILFILSMGVLNLIDTNNSEK